LAATLFLCFVFQLFVLGEFVAIEKHRSTLNANRVMLALEATLKTLEAKAVDWGQWDDTYNFIEDRNQEYIDSMLIYDTLAPILVRHIVYVNAEGKALISRKVDSDNQAASAAPENEVAQLLSLPNILTYKDSLSRFHSVARIENNLFFVVSVPIVDSKREKAPRGTLILTQPITPTFIQAISTQTRLQVSGIDLNPTTQNTLSKEQKQALQVLRSSNDSFSEIQDRNNILGFGALFDTQNKPALLLEVRQAREIYAQGISVRNYLFVSLFLTATLALIATMVLLNRTIIRRLAFLGRYLQQITETRDFSQRVMDLGSDELGTLTTEINSMLTSLQEANKDTNTALEAARTANEAKSTFIAKVSHELRTPIHGIVGMLRILLKEEASKTRKSYISMAKNSAFSLLDTINEILDFSKVETGNLSLEQIDFTLRTVVREALSTVGPRAEEKDSLELVVDVFHDLPDTFVGDPLRLKQCLINLLGNAIKFTKEGFVKLELRSGGREGDKHRMLISVSDSGVGIPAERLPRIFDPFTQADDSVARLFAGTGLGLTIVKQLVEQMGGTVQVQSEVGKGTTFTLSIPLPCTADAQHPPCPLPVIPPRVAIIDESSHTLETFKAGLARHQIACHHVSPNDTRGLATLSTQLAEYGLVLVTSNALKRSRVFNIVVEVAAQKAAPLAVILSPFEIAVRERLAALNIPYIMMRPISLEDIILAVAGELDLSKTEWEQEEDVLLVQSRKLRVLVADDAETNRIILSSMLEEAGHEVVCVENGLDLVAALETQIADSAQTTSFDIVLTDIQMPMMDGLSATQKVRALEASHGSGSRIPIVAVTAHAMPNETDRMRACGVDDVVTKPIHPSELARALSALTGSTPAKPSTAPINQALHADTDDDQLDPRATRELQALQDTSFRMWKQLRSEQSFQDFESAEDEIPFAQVLDIADVFERAGDSSRRTRLILSAFLDSFKEPLSELTKAKSASDTKGLSYSAHALKGLLLDIGAKTSGKIASNIEQFGKQDNFAEGAALVTELGNQVLIIARLVQKIVDAWPVDSGQRPVA
jgi:signal transduction histidine kinase/CheY-like chemotaxis protein/HPt (histidine-containing phosphotransfer) domain-containing protein